MALPSSNSLHSSEVGIQISDSNKHEEIKCTSENLGPLPFQSFYFNPNSEFFDIVPDGEPVFLPRPTPIQKFVTQLQNLDYKRLLKKRRRRPSDINPAEHENEALLMDEQDPHGFETSDVASFSSSSDNEEEVEEEVSEEEEIDSDNEEEEGEEGEEEEEKEKEEEPGDEEEVKVNEVERNKNSNTIVIGQSVLEDIQQSKINTDPFKENEVQPSNSQLSSSQQSKEPLESMRERVNRHLEIACHEIWALKHLSQMLLENPPPSQPPSTDPPYFKKAIHPIPFPKPEFPIKRQLDDLAFAYGSKQAHLKSAANLLRLGAKRLGASIREEAHFLIQEAVPLRNRFWRMGIHPNGGIYVDYAFDSFFRVLGRADFHRVFTHPSKKKKLPPNTVQISPRLQLYFQPQLPSVCSIEVTFHSSSKSSPKLPVLFPLSHSHVEKQLRNAQCHLNQKQLFLQLCEEASKVPQVTVKDETIVLFLGHKGSVHITLTKKPLKKHTPETLLLQHMSLSRFSDWVQFNAFATDIFNFLFPLLRRIHACTPLDFSHTLLNDLIQFKIIFLTSKRSLELTLQSPAVLTVRVMSGRHVVLFHPKQVIPLLQHQVQLEIIHLFKLFVTPSTPLPSFQVHLSSSTLSVSVESVASIHEFSPGWIGQLVMQLGLV